MDASDYAQIASSIAAFVAVVVAALTLLQSARTFKKQTENQAEQAAHTAVQEHMKLRIDNADINEMEHRLNGSPDRADELSPAELSLYINIAEHGIAMAEYVYKLVGEDKGWRDTVASWIATYRPYLLGRKIVCGHYRADFIRLIGEVLSASCEDFCEDLSRPT